MKNKRIITLNLPLALSDENLALVSFKPDEKSMSGAVDQLEREINSRFTYLKHKGMPFRKAVDEAIEMYNSEIARLLPLAFTRNGIKVIYVQGFKPLLSQIPKERSDKPFTPEDIHKALSFVQSIVHDPRYVPEEKRKQYEFIEGMLNRLLMLEGYPTEAPVPQTNEMDS